MKRYRVGVIGFGGMGQYWTRELAASRRWNVATICDVRAEARAKASQKYPAARVTADADEVFADATLDAVGVFTLADRRPDLLERALAAGKHVLAEKPLADTVAREEQLLRTIEASGRHVAVNLFNRNAWYHRQALAFIASGQIGELAVVRVRHQTPGILPFSGRAPTEALSPEGAPFHDCGMHYVDVARWYAGGEYVRGQWHAQGTAFWGVAHPWWINAHGVFSNGVVFDITQGSCYGHLAKDKGQSCGLEAIGTLGVVRYSHDFKTVNLECFGIRKTVRKVGPYGNKKLDVMVEVFAKSLDADRNLGYPTARDAVIASRVSAEMVEQASRAVLPMKGTLADLQRIFDHHRELIGVQRYAPGFGPRASGPSQKNTPCRANRGRRGENRS